MLKSDFQGDGKAKTESKTPQNPAVPRPGTLNPTDIPKGFETMGGTKHSYESVLGKGGTWLHNSSIFMSQILHILQHLLDMPSHTVLGAHKTCS